MKFGNKLIWNRNFLGSWIPSKVKDFRNMSNDEKLKHLDKLISEVERDEVLRTKWYELGDSREEVILLIKEIADKPNKLDKNTGKLFFLVELYQQRQQKYEELKKSL